MTPRVGFVATTVAALLVSGCGDHPVPERGRVTDAQFTPAWMQWMPGATTCAGNPPMCTTGPGDPLFHPDQWSLTITDLKNPDWQGTMTFDDSSVFNRCNLGELWPECSQEASGDAR